MKKYSLLVLALVLAFFIGCPKKNHPPEITGITATPADSINTGGKVHLKVEADDEDGDDLDFTWSASSGTLSATTGEEVDWTAPNDTGTYTITVKAEDEEDEDEATKDIKVYSQTLIVSGTVTWPGHTLSNYCIAFLDTSHTTTIYLVGVVNVNPATGAYTISYQIAQNLEAYVEAFDDINNNGYIDTGEGLGYYDANSNGQWDDMLTFTPGQTLNNANITLLTVTKQGKNGVWQKPLK